ncbi:hypothetical protein PHYC_02649 [Phycisphaerales bacterium]|nr:hypothetical protein PHYC_02649 [Phycisphaerales bacterium]
MDFSFTFKRNTKGAAGGGPQQDSEGERQYNQIRGCGITLKPPLGFWDIQRGHDPEGYAREPFSRLLKFMGATHPDQEFWSNDIWHYTPSAAPDESELVSLYTNVKRLVKDAVPMGDASSSTNYETNVVTITAEVNSNPESWDLDPAAGDLPTQLLTKLAASLAAAGEGRIGACDVEGGKLIVFLNETEISELADTTSMPWGAVV